MTRHSHPRRWLATILFAVFLLPAAWAKNPAQELLKSLEQAVKAKVQEGLTAKFLRYDAHARTLAFSPLFLQLAGRMFQEQSKLFKEFQVETRDNQLSLNLLTEGGIALQTSIIPEALEVSLNEMAFKGKLPGGVQLSSAKTLQDSITGIFDTVFGVPNQVGALVRNFQVEGDSFRFTRPVKASFLGRILANQTAGGSLTPSLPLTIRDGWLTLDMGPVNPTDGVIRLLTEVLLDKLKGKLGDLGKLVDLGGL
jgi:hypothetical protein